MIRTITVIGGDSRQLYMSGYLKEKGYDVKIFGCEHGKYPEGVKGCESIDKAVLSDVLILPLPVSKNGNLLNTPLSSEEIKLREITERINEKVFYNEQWFNKKDFAKIKNHDLIEQLSCMREKMCGIGTRKVKLLLNEKIKEGDYIAELYRTALEIEDLNISAKKYHGEYREKYYSKKNDNILLLSELCNKYNVEYGIEEVYGGQFNVIFYFDLPDMRQISFHTRIKKRDMNKYPKYNKKWDGEINSTLLKIEETLNKIYFDN